MTIKLTFNIGVHMPTFFRKTVSTGKESLIGRLRREIETARLACSNSTTVNRKTAVNALERFFNERLDGGKDITIDTLTPDHIRGFERWHAEKRLTVNYSACNMRNLRTLLNRIVGTEGHGRVKELFKDVRTRKSQAQTKKAVDEETIKKLANMEVKIGSFEEKAKDLFLFCLMNRGMPLIDALYLKKSQLRDGRINYYRHKTQTMARPEALPEVMCIIEKYATEESSYLLPFLTSDDPLETEKQYHYFLQKYNRTLRKLAKRISTDCKLTSYTPRHTWASIAHQLGISDNDISQALAHTNTQTTQEYLKNICDEKIDGDNRLVLEKAGIIKFLKIAAN